MLAHRFAVTGAVLLIVVALPACTSDTATESAAPVPESSATTSSPTAEADDNASTDPAEGTYDGPTIPEGMYTRHLTRAEAERAANMHGLSADTTDEILGIFTQDLAYSFKIEGASWGQYTAVDGGEADLGDFGTFTYDEEGSWVTVSDDTGCPACVIAYHWTLEGDELTLRVVPGHDEDDFAAFVTDGTYELMQ